MYILSLLLFYKLLIVFVFLFLLVNRFIYSSAQHVVWNRIQFIVYVVDFVVHHCFLLDSAFFFFSPFWSFSFFFIYFSSKDIFCFLH
jgi:hypothetical protein